MGLNRQRPENAVGAIHLIDAVGLIFSDGPSMAGRATAIIACTAQSMAQVLGSAVGCQRRLAMGRGDESNVGNCPTTVYRPG
jgi:hypothetical protein